MSRRIVTFGEIMLRLKAPGHERLFQSAMLEATFGGAECNVAVSLAQFGHAAAFVTLLPPNAVGDAALAELRRFGVDVGHVRRSSGRMGTYYLEAGANQRPGIVVYDRAGSSIAGVQPGDIDWAAVFDGADWFHLTGITPAISANAAAQSLAAVQEARARGIPVSCDVNHRANLWQYGRPAHDVMPEIVRHVQVLIANEEDCRKSLALELDAARSGPAAPLEMLSRHVCDVFPNVKKHVMTRRESHSADHNGLSACLFDGTTLHRSRSYAITHIVDRIGAGDAFTAGLIHGLLAYRDDARALEFATAAGCLKHSIPGDFNRVSVTEVERLLEGDGSGRIQR